MSSEGSGTSGDRGAQALQSKVFSTGTLTAGLTTLDFQQCKLERMDKEIQDCILLRCHSDQVSHKHAPNIPGSIQTKITGKAFDRNLKPKWPRRSSRE